MNRTSALGPTPNRTSAIRPNEGQTIMFVAAPIRTVNGEVVAAVAFGILPELEFTDILTVARAGRSGETLAFDENGWMLSDSRFDDELKADGILADEPEVNAVLNVRLVKRVQTKSGDQQSSPSFTDDVAATLAAIESQD